MSSSLSVRPDLPALPPRWTSLDAATLQGDRLEGVRAGEGAEPPAEAMERHWKRLAVEGSGDLQRLTSACARLLEDLGARMERLKQERDAEVVKAAEANQRQHTEALGNLKRELGPDSSRYRELSAASEDTDRALRTVRSDVEGRPLRTHFVGYYLVIMAILAIAEVPVNRAAFELTFREQPVISLGLAAAVGVILIFFAHLIGVILRRWPPRPTAGGVVARVAALVLIVGLVGAIIYYVARMRQTFMRLAQADNEGFAARLREALRGGTQEAVNLTAEVPFTVSDWTFIAINLLIFAFGVATSFLRHDPHPDYERATRDATRRGRAFGKARTKYAGALAAETARYEDRKRALETRLGDLEATITALQGQFAGIREHPAACRSTLAGAVARRASAFAEGFATGGPGKGFPRPPGASTVLTEIPPPELSRAA